MRMCSAVEQFRSRTSHAATSSATCDNTVGFGVRSAYLSSVLPYAYGRPDLYRAAFCLRENGIVRKKPECWTCSWCVTGSDIMVSTAFEARGCKVTQMRMGRGKQDTANIGRRAA